MKNMLRVSALMLLLPASIASAQLGPLEAGYIYTVAGDGYMNPRTGYGGFSGDGGSSTSAELNSPTGETVDGAGNIYIADTRNHRIRMVNAATGIITTFVGNGYSGFSGDSILIPEAEVGSPAGVAADAAGKIYIADVLNDRILEVNPATGYLSLFAGNGTTEYSGDGGPAVKAGIYVSGGIASDASGNVYIADSNNLIRKVDAATRIISTVAGNGTYGANGDGGPATDAELEQPYQVALDTAGNLYFTETGDSRVRMVDASTSIITTVAGNGMVGSVVVGEPAVDISFIDPSGLAVDAAGNVYISDGVIVYRVDAVTGIIDPYAGDAYVPVPPPPPPVLPPPPCYGGAGGSALDAYFCSVNGLALDKSGNLYIADQTANLIWVVGSEADAIATTTTLTSSADELYYGQPLTLTATVTAESSGTPTGAVSFLSGTTFLGRAALNPSGVATLTLTPAGGTYSLTAAYNATPKYQSSVSEPPIPLTVYPDPTSTVLTASPNPAYWGNPVTFTATVSSTIVTPAGSVIFYDGTTLLATKTLSPGGVATFSTIALSVGSHNITADFVANPDFSASTSNLVVEVITPVDFSISAAPDPQNVYTGLAASYTVTITPTPGWTLPIALSCTQLPANSSCTFSPATVSGGTWSSALIVQTTAPSPATSVLSLKLPVTVLAGLFLLILPSRLRRSRKGWPLLMVVFAILAAGSVITGCSAPGPLTGATAVGAQTITITGIATNGAQSLTHAANVTLNVNSLF